MALHTGITALGVATKALEIATANTALTIKRRRKITIMKSVRARGPTTSPVSDPTDVPLLRTLAQMAPKSCTPAKKTVPKMDPDERRQPSPDDRDGRPDDRRRTRNGREMVAPQHDLVRGNKVHVVPHRVGRCLEVRVELVDLLGDELRVETNSLEPRPSTDYSEDNCTHSSTTIYVGREPRERTPHVRRMNRRHQRPPEG